YNTDIDLFFLTGASQKQRYGVDFSRNLGSNFEIHGEFAYLADLHSRILGPDGDIRTRSENIRRWLVGLRYITRSETTWIAEYYHNGAGVSSTKMDRYYAFIEHGRETFSTTGSSTLLHQAGSLGQSTYIKQTPMRNYLYVRVSQKDAFDILYFTPAATTIVNLDDTSFSFSPEVIYTGITNLELRFKATLLHGERWSEYREKYQDWRLELRLRAHF
ncbi:MAG: hypothetical protein ABR516_05220, partial [Desulfuromonadaceae bacterium]